MTFYFKLERLLLIFCLVIVFTHLRDINIMPFSVLGFLFISLLVHQSRPCLISVPKGSFKEDLLSHKPCLE